jgi:hypothetical protein
MTTRNVLTRHELRHLNTDEPPAMFDAITERNTTIDLAQQSDDPDLRAAVRGGRTTGSATMHRIGAVCAKPSTTRSAPSG